MCVCVCRRRGCWGVNTDSIMREDVLAGGWHVCNLDRCAAAEKQWKHDWNVGMKEHTELLVLLQIPACLSAPPAGAERVTDADLLEAFHYKDLLL